MINIRALIAIIILLSTQVIAQTSASFWRYSGTNTIYFYPVNFPTGCPATIAWGDGNTETATDLGSNTALVHIYSNTGSYGITITPSCGATISKVATTPFGGNCNYSVTLNYTHSGASGVYKINPSVSGGSGNYSFHWIDDLGKIRLDTNTQFTRMPANSQLSLSYILTDKTNKCSNNFATATFNSPVDFANWSVFQSDSVGACLKKYTFGYSLSSGSSSNTVATLTDSATNNVVKMATFLASSGVWARNFDHNLQHNKTYILKYETQLVAPGSGSYILTKKIKTARTPTKPILGTDPAGKTSISAGDSLYIYGQCSSSGAVWETLSNTGSAFKKIKPTQTTTYVAKCKDETGCVSLKDSITITVTPCTNQLTDAFLCSTTTKNAAVYAEVSTNMNSTGWAGYFKGRGYFSDKVGIGVSSIPQSLSSTIVIDMSSGILPNSTKNLSNYKLFVKGGILTEEITLKSGWADYVFDKNYKMSDLSEVENFIQKYGRLPKTPSTQSISENGLEVGNMMVLQQEKIEEIYLHLIEMSKEIQGLKNKNLLLENELKNLKK